MNSSYSTQSPSPGPSADALRLVDGEDANFFNLKRKAPGACVDCKSVKVRCEHVPGQRRCKRCQLKNLPCQARLRKKRKAAETHEELQEKAHQQDLQIQELLKQYDKQRAAEKINHWINKSQPTGASHSQGSNESIIARRRWMQRGKSVEQASMSYFKSRNAGRNIVLPSIVAHCDLYPEEMEQLFSIFFERINPYFSILDVDFHKPGDLIWSSPFLFTVICAIASRYFSHRPELYSLAMDFARDAAGKALVEGKRSIDMCQAYLLMAVYPVPKKKWVEDRSWLLMGVAIRMAMELGLNQPAPVECTELEQLDRMRTWLNCYCVDGSHAIQFGKMPMIPVNDYLARSSATWYRSSRNTPFDVHLCGYVQILCIMGEWRMATNTQASDPSSTGADAIRLAIDTQERLQVEIDNWRKAYAREYELYPLAVCAYRGHTTPMITAYLQLVVLSSGFLAALKDGLQQDAPILLLSIQRAHTVIQMMVDNLAPTPFLRYAMDANFLYVSFAASFLLNLLNPRFRSLISDLQRQKIIEQVTHLASVLGSPGVALDGKHAAALHSRFLSSVLSNHHSSTSGIQQPQQQQQSIAYTPVPNPPFIPYNLKETNAPSSDAQIWSLDSQKASPFVSPLPSGNVSWANNYQQPGDSDLDFSLDQFVKKVKEGLPTQYYRPMNGHQSFQQVLFPSDWRNLAYTGGGLDGSHSSMMPGLAWADVRI